MTGRCLVSLPVYSMYHFGMVATVRHNYIFWRSDLSLRNSNVEMVYFQKRRMRIKIATDEHKKCNFFYKNAIIMNQVNWFAAPVLIINVVLIKLIGIVKRTMQTHNLAT